MGHASSSVVEGFYAGVVCDETCGMDEPNSPITAYQTFAPLHRLGYNGLSALPHSL